MRIAIFKRNQNAETEAPAHMASQSLAAKICEAVPVKILSDRAIQLNTNETFAEIKARFRPKTRGKANILPIREWRQPLLIYYPVRDQSNFA